MHQVDQRCLITAQDPVDQQVAGLNDVLIQVESPRQQKGLASLLIGTRNPVRAQVGSTGRNLPPVLIRVLAKPDVNEIGRIGDVRPGHHVA